MIKTVGAKILQFAVLAFIVLVVVAIGNIMLKTLTTNQLKTFNQHIDTLGFYMQFIRWGFYLLLFVYWERVIRFLGRIKQWDQGMIERGLHSKYQSMAVLLAVELFLIQAIQNPVIRYFTS